jgi:hypothetical protein
MVREDANWDDWEDFAKWLKPSKKIFPIAVNYPLTKILEKIKETVIEEEEKEEEGVGLVNDKKLFGFGQFDDSTQKGLTKKLFEMLNWDEDDYWEEDLEEDDDE